MEGRMRVRRGEIKAVISEGGRSVFSTDERIETDGEKKQRYNHGGGQKDSHLSFPLPPHTPQSSNLGATFGGL